MQLYEVLGKGLHIAKRVRESELEQRFAVAGELVELTEHAAAPLLALKRLRPVAPVRRNVGPVQFNSGTDADGLRHASEDAGEQGQSFIVPAGGEQFLKASRTSGEVTTHDHSLEPLGKGTHYHGPQPPDTHDVDAGADIEAANANFHGSVTDSARALADEHGIDLLVVKGTGAGGRITKPDVDQFVGNA